MRYCEYDDYDDGYDSPPARTGWCSACGERCTVITIDEGIGEYEYWGHREIDSRVCEVSDCCEAEVLDNEPEIEE